MLLRKARRTGSYVRFQYLPKWTEDGELVACEYVRATYNGNDLGVVTIARLKPRAETRERIANAVLEICERLRADGPTPCHYPECDCGIDAFRKGCGVDAFRERARAILGEDLGKAEQDKWDAAQLARQHGDEMVSRSGEVRLGPKPYHAGRFMPSPFLDPEHGKYKPGDAVGGYA